MNVVKNELTEAMTNDSNIPTHTQNLKFSVLGFVNINHVSQDFLLVNDDSFAAPVVALCFDDW